jgi:hypothetical protein
MGQRREPRKEIRLPVRIFGTDAQGRTFSENVFTVDVSREGARLSGVQAQIKPGEIIGLTHGKNKGHFTVRWTGQAGQIGLANAKPGRWDWDLPLPETGPDPFGHQKQGGERRKYPRLRCVASVELQAEGEGAPIRAKAGDLSLGGCFVEMPIPLRAGTKLKVGLWIKDTKLLANAKVVSSRPGFGIGIEFSDMPAEAGARLKDFLQGLTRIPM